MSGLTPAIARAVAGGQDCGARWARARGSLRLLLPICAVTSLAVVPLSVVGLAPSRPGTVLTAVTVAAVYAIYFGLKCILFAVDAISDYARWELTSDVIFVCALSATVLLAPAAALVTFAAAYGVFIAGVCRLIRAKSLARERVDVDRRFAGIATLATYSSIARLPLVTATAGLVSGSTDAAGIAGVTAILMPLFLVPQAAGMVTFAGFARGATPGQHRELFSLVRAVAVGSIAACVALFVLAKPLVQLLLGSGYRTTGVALGILAIGALPQLIATPVGNAISGEGDAGINAALGGVALAVAVAGTIVLTPTYHVTGAAVALAASMAVLGCGTLIVGWLRYVPRFPAPLETGP